MFEDVETNVACFVDVAMVDGGAEANSGRGEGIGGREDNVEEEGAAFVAVERLGMRRQEDRYGDP
jgi:hypothetical protein